MRRNENPDVMIRKCFREVQLSGIVTEAKRRRFREKEISRTKKREAAIRKAVKNEYKRGW